MARLDLDPADALHLATLLYNACLPVRREPSDARPEALAVLPDLRPGRGFLDTQGTARYLGTAASTIRSWTARGGPKHHPFPHPTLRHQRRNYWCLPVIEQWRTEEKELDRIARETRRRGRPTQ
ncbi:hypothetical protein [Nonomuraea salmonea]|uniref:DNA-binding protein n=1 Tax=Nonomuraea salmonea TaxID=46181 RepID=A0ABV5NEW1_9ACTN